jgi:hypothetical protein
MNLLDRHTLPLLRDTAIVIGGLALLWDTWGRDAREVAGRAAGWPRVQYGWLAKLEPDYRDRVVRVRPASRQEWLAARTSDAEGYGGVIAVQGGTAANTAQVLAAPAAAYFAGAAHLYSIGYFRVVDAPTIDPAPDRDARAAARANGGDDSPCRAGRASQEAAKTRP